MDNNNEKMYKNKTRRQTKLVTNIIIFLILIVSGTLLLNKSIRYENTEIIKYTEKSNLDYKVYLLKNDFYDQPYLGKDMLYVASLIDKIHLDFKYRFEMQDKETLDFTYKIVGKLSITNNEGTKAYFEKTYTLLDSKKVSMKNESIKEINDEIDVDYPHYNSLANNFKNAYGIDTESNLTIYMVIDKKSNEESNFTLDSSSMLNVKIPLSERSVNIELDYKDISNTSNIIKDKKIEISNIILLVLSVILILLSIVYALKIVRKINKMKPKKSNYDKIVSKYLKEYDRLIAESSTLLSFEGKEIIRVSKFTELLDIHDNVQLPIMYYEITKHELSYFYISHSNTIYLFEVHNEEKNY